MPHLVLRLMVLLAVLLAWAPAPPAAAHGELLFSDPPADGVVQALPSRAFLTFSDAVSEIREITVVGPEGSVTNGAPSSIGPEVRQTLWEGVDGAYTLEYYVVSADGHDVRGEVHFEVGPTSTAATTGTSGDEPQASGEDPPSEGRFAAVLPAGLVLVAAAVALALLRRRRSTATGPDNG
ncbi:hypothetical protein SAMN05192575_102494 [Nocardioides alpinus]|uniref:CopC domain-containing protein n=1 Tax=Nocardioides alpinus TaxID=748909 RepID=A0A1I0XML4_9ACTN|nr:copper resistance CopC family protein [Nocardioides alpinus]SFB01540.1 hypothetical protein SAMN05192575_102494 [Nocardioides alpinus]